jgi:copper(I)-binding protein
MRAFFIAVLALTISACTPAAPPAPRPAAGLTVENAWAAATPNGVDVSAGYLTIRNGAAEADRLISVESTRAERVEVHEMIMDGAVMRMRPVETIEITAGGDAVLEQGGRHLMFYGVTQPFAEGEDIPVRFQFEHAGAVDVSLPVRRTAAHDGH